MLRHVEQACQGLAIGASLILTVHGLQWLAENVEPVPAMTFVLFVAGVGWLVAKSIREGSR